MYYYRYFFGKLFEVITKVKLIEHVSWVALTVVRSTCECQFVMSFPWVNTGFSITATLSGLSRHTSASVLVILYAGLSSDDAWPCLPGIMCSVWYSNIVPSIFVQRFQKPFYWYFNFVAEYVRGKHFRLILMWRLCTIFRLCL